MNPAAYRRIGPENDRSRPGLTHLDRISRFAPVAEIPGLRLGPWACSRRLIRDGYAVIWCCQMPVWIFKYSCHALPDLPAPIFSPRRLYWGGIPHGPFTDAAGTPYPARCGVSAIIPLLLSPTVRSTYRAGSLLESSHSWVQATLSQHLGTQVDER